MITHDEIQALIYQALDELNELRVDAELIVKEPDTALFGQSSPLDSVDLVTLLLCVEEQLEDDFDIAFTIANEKAMSEKNSPFRTVQSLANYILTSVSE